MNDSERILNLEEISNHKTKDDVWIILYDKVYDISSVLPHHPGGVNIILKHIAKSQDLTEPFEEMQHSSKARYTVSEFCVGSIRKPNSKTKTLFSQIESSKPSQTDLSQNIWDYQPSQSVQMEIVRNYGQKKIIGWGDLFSVNIEMLDNQHKNIINLMNKIYNFGNISDLNEFIVAWNTHCETEQYLFDVYGFENHKRKLHIQDHQRITDLSNSMYDSLVQKYDDQLSIDFSKKDDINTEKFECAELIHFIEQTMGPTFKRHAFEYDSLYVDKFGEKDPSIYVKWEKSTKFDLMRPIFPSEEKMNLAIFQDAVYGNQQLMLQLQKTDPQ